MAPELSVAAASLGAIVAIWIGYPSVVMLLASARRRRPRAAGPLPSLSVIIATRDSVEAISRKVANILAADYAQECLEVIVAVDHAATVPSHLPGIEDSRVRIRASAAPAGKASTLNTGVAAARGDLLVLTDTYQMLDRGALIALARAFATDDIGAVSGFLELRSGEVGSPMDAYWRMERHLRHAEGQLSSSVGVTGALYAIRRELWPALPPSVLLDDVFVPMSVVLQGRRVIVEPSAIAFEQRSTSPQEEYLRKTRTLAGNIQLVRLLPAVLHPRRNPIWLQFMFHKLLRLATPFLALGLLAGLGSYSVNHQGSAPTAIVLMVLGAGLLTLAASTRGRHFLKWFVYLQGATLAGIFYGLRGRDDIWRHRRSEGV